MGLNEYILYFQIPVYDILPMAIADCTNNLFEVIFCFCLGDSLPLPEQFQQFPTL